MIYKIILFCITALGFIGCLTFVLRYWYTAGNTWRNNEAGRFFMVVYANLAALFLLVMANQIWTEWPGKKLVSMILFATYVLETWWPIRLLTFAQRLARKKRESVLHD